MGRAFLILGNQLFTPELISPKGKSRPVIFMKEDLGLCTHFRYHKHKILFFLSAMRKYANELKASGFEVHYEKLGDSDLSFESSLLAFLDKCGCRHLEFFEIEDKFFETRIAKALGQAGVSFEVHRSPMFLTARSEFREYLDKTKKPFMKTFYERQRKRLKILVDKNGNPEGGRWSFDDENRSALPKDYAPPEIPHYQMDEVEKKVAALVEKKFSTHPGDTKNFWLPTDRAGAELWLEKFLEERFFDFGPYEDALSSEHVFLNHSVLTPYLNVGLLTPEQVVANAIKVAKKKKIPMNSCEGFIRQVIGWREFIRGIYQNFSERQEQSNFFRHERKLNGLWYSGKTGIAPLDDVIQKTLKFSYAHHIERLMVVGSLMLLLEIHPKEAHRWFMEMFIDSSDWVMGPNVYGMALFSDGGIFSTKPYICGSNYYKKLGGYKNGDWQEGVDGLYWSFLEKHKQFFLKNPRLAMMARAVEKMPSEKKKRLYRQADCLRERLTQS